tara:strand:+ start:225 stop:767 length:543 start_codon:yes stop_codon:yes gene_type:complete
MEEIEQLKTKLDTLQLEMEHPDLCRTDFDKLYSEMNELKSNLDYLKAKKKGEERVKAEEEEKVRLLEEERKDKVRKAYAEELNKHNQNWQKVINLINRQCQKTEELHEQMHTALPNEPIEYRQYFNPENQIKWFYLSLFSLEHTGLFSRVGHSMAYPPIHRKILMKEHEPPMKQLNGVNK